MPGTLAAYDVSIAYLDRLSGLAALLTSAATAAATSLLPLPSCHRFAKNLRLTVGVETMISIYENAL